MPYMRAYSFILGMYPVFHSEEHSLTFGATFFVWRDFFSLLRLFFAGATFFSGSTFWYCRPLLELLPAQVTITSSCGQDG